MSCQLSYEARPESKVTSSSCEEAVAEHRYVAGPWRSRGNYSSLATRRALLTSRGSRYIRSITFLLDFMCFNSSAELEACCTEMPSSTCGFNAHKTQSMCCEKAKYRELSVGKPLKDIERRLRLI